MSKKSQTRNSGHIDIFVAQADLVQEHHHDPPPSDHTAVGRIAASTASCAPTTAALFSSQYNCCCLLLFYHTEEIQASYEYEKCEGRSCVSPNAQTWIVVVIHPYEIWSYRCTATKMQQRSYTCLLYTSPSPRDRTRSRMPSSA